MTVPCPRHVDTSHNWTKRAIYRSSLVGNAFHSEQQFRDIRLLDPSRWRQDTTHGCNEPQNLISQQLHFCTEYGRPNAVSPPFDRSCSIHYFCFADIPKTSYCNRKLNEKINNYCNICDLIEIIFNAYLHVLVLFIYNCKPRNCRYSIINIYFSIKIFFICFIMFIENYMIYIYLITFYIYSKKQQLLSTKEIVFTLTNCLISINNVNILQ